MADSILSSEVSEMSWTFVAMSVHKPYLAHIQRRYSLDSNLDRLLRLVRGQGHMPNRDDWMLQPGMSYHCRGVA